MRLLGRMHRDRSAILEGRQPRVFSISLPLIVYLYTDSFRRGPESCYVNESSSRSLQSSLAAIVLETSTLMEGTKTGTVVSI